ncbi:MAG: ATP-grasp domain-containing protein [Candidatus Bathyarchaeota archaeon]|nr:MAG: ATP-grasp domain-containing protein [Candidatus Bathyarchaeota archaeon]
MAEVGIPDFRNLLVIGVDIVSLAASAKRAGYEVFAVDHFGDLDLKRECRRSLSIVKQRTGRSCGHLGSDFSPRKLLELTKRLLKRYEMSKVLLSSGLDDSSDILFELNELVPILGNHPSVIERIRDKTRFFHELNRLGVSHPATVIVEDFEEARKEARNIGYPIIIKPWKGFGGVGVRKADDSRGLKPAFGEASLLDKRVLIQEYIPGKCTSASVLSSINGAAILTLSEQLIGMQELGQREPFGYCGNVVPLLASTEVTSECESIIKKVAQHFNLIGSNGVDLVISEEGTPYVIEVNPRFQGTIECVERVLGMNLVAVHEKACVQGVLPKNFAKPFAFCARFILFAPQRLVTPDLHTFGGVRDIPLPGIVLEEGEPLCSFTIEGLNMDFLLQKASETTEVIYDSCDYMLDH